MRRWDPTVAAASRQYGVPASWIRAVIRAESGGRTMMGENTPIVSRMGAVGLMQLMPQTYSEMRVAYRLGTNPFDPHDNIMAGAAYLRALYKQYGYPKMFAAYNDGPGHLEQRLMSGGLLPLETQLYVASVTGKFAAGGGPRSMVRFTRPNGSAVMINGYEVAAVRAPFPGEYAPGVRAVIAVGKLQQGVRESVAAARALLRRHGSRV